MDTLLVHSTVLCVSKVQYVCSESVVIYLQRGGEKWSEDCGKVPGP